MSAQQPTVFDLPKVLAVGVASPAAAVLTSRFGVAGTLLGMALSAVLITVAVDFLKVYLARVPGAVTTIPGGFRKRSFLRNVFERMKLPFSKFSSLPRPRRRSILIGSVGAAGISFVVGLVVLTGVELGVGKSVSCWVWEECSTEESSADGSSSTSSASTLTSILGGGQSASNPTTEEQVGPLNPPQQQPGSSSSPAGASGAPSQSPSGGPLESGTPTPSPSAQPGQRQGPSGVVEEDPQQSPSNSGAPADQK